VISGSAIGAKPTNPSCGSDAAGLADRTVRSANVLGLEGTASAASLGAVAFTEADVAALRRNPCLNCRREESKRKVGVSTVHDGRALGQAMATKRTETPRSKRASSDPCKASMMTAMNAPEPEPAEGEDAMHVWLGGSGVCVGVRA